MDVTDGLPPGWTCSKGIVAPGEAVRVFRTAGAGVRGIAQL